MQIARTCIAPRMTKVCAGLALIAAFGLTAGAGAQADDTRDRPARPSPTTERDTTPPPDRRPAEQMERRAAVSEATLRGRRVAILVGEGFHDGEALMPMAYLANRGAMVTVIGIEPGIVKAYNSDMTLRIERSVNDVNFRQFDALILPGGRAPSVLRENQNVVNFTRQFFESGRLVAAICHGPQVLVTAGVLEGRHATCIDRISSELEEAGARYDDKPVIRDDNLITSRIPDDIPAFSKKIEEVLIETADERRSIRPPRRERPDRPERPRRPDRAPGGERAPGGGR